MEEYTLKVFRENYVRQVPSSTIEEAFMAGAFTAINMATNGIDIAKEIAAYNVVKQIETGVTVH